MRMIRLSPTAMLRLARSAIVIPVEPRPTAGVGDGLDGQLNVFIPCQHRSRVCFLSDLYRNDL